MEDVMGLLLPAFFNAVLPIGGTILTGIVGLVAVKAKKWISARVDNEMADAAMTRITNTAQTVVDELNQTLVPQILAASADGKFTLDDARVLKNEAIGMMREQLPEAIKQAAGLAANDLGSLISAKIEQAVAKAKASGTAPVKSGS